MEDRLYELIVDKIILNMRVKSSDSINSKISSIILVYTGILKNCKMNKKNYFTSKLRVIYKFAVQIISKIFFILQ